MKTIFKLKTVLFVCILFTINSCTNDINSVKNNNDPNAAQVLATGNDLTSVLSGGFVTWWQAGNRDTYPALAVAGDIATCSWGNYGMRVLSNEPRNAIPNTNSWSDSGVLEQPWGGYYSAASGASDVIKAIQNGVKYKVEGVDDVLVKLARCCTPVPGDEIMGFITKGSGISVHRKDCRNAADLIEHQVERVVGVSWLAGAASIFLVNIQIEALDRSRLLADVTRTLSEQHVNVLSAAVSTSKDRVAISKFTFEMADAKHLDSVLAAVRSVEGVYDVYRT